MFRSLNYSYRMLHKLHKSSVPIKFRNFSQFADGSGGSNVGEDGHYDIIIVGGGAAGISLAGSVGNCFLYVLFDILSK